MKVIAEHHHHIWYLLPALSVENITCEHCERPAGVCFSATWGPFSLHLYLARYCDQH